MRPLQDSMTPILSIRDIRAMCMHRYLDPIIVTGPSIITIHQSRIDLDRKRITLRQSRKAQCLRPGEVSFRRGGDVPSSAHMYGVAVVGGRAAGTAAAVGSTQGTHGAVGTGTLGMVVPAVLSK